MPSSRLASSRVCLCPTLAQTTVQGQVAAAAYLASSKGKALPGVSVTALTSHLSMHMKDFFNHALEQHARLYPGIELTELVPVKRAYLASTIAYAKWKEFSRTLFPSGFAGATSADTEEPRPTEGAACGVVCWGARSATSIAASRPRRLLWCWRSVRLRSSLYLTEEEEER